MSAFAGTVAVVTGAARGIGLAIAQAFAADGAAVALLDRDADALAAGADALAGTAAPVRAIRADVTRYADLAEAAAAVGAERPLAALVNNAGLFRRQASDGEHALVTWDALFAVNARGAYATTLAFLPLLRASRGAVVNVASVRAVTAAERASAYTASKAAVAGLTIALAAELAADGIRVNAVAPGDVATAMTAGDPVSAALAARTPLGRFAAPEEVAAAVLFLASPAARFITGAMLPVDGGFLTR